MDWTTTLLPLATAFGMALLHSLWIGALLYCLVRTVLPFLPGPGARHNVAYLALLALGASFVASLFYLYEPVTECSAEAVATGLFIVPPALPETATPLEAFIASVQAYAPWLSAAYVLGLLPAILLLIRDQRQSWSLRHRGTEKLPAAWRAQFRRELDRYPALVRVRCHLSEQAGEVMTLGWWSPMIVFPVALVNELTPEMARTILLHEIAHLRHYDHFLNYPQQLLRTLFFFHPAAHALCHIIDREREHRCDDWVAARCDDRRTYATALVTVARSSIQPQNTLAMSATKTPFTARIQRLFGGDNQKRDGQYALSVLMIVFLAAAQTGFAQLGADAGATDCPEEPALIARDTPEPLAIADLSPVTVVAMAETETSLPPAASLRATPKVKETRCPDCGEDGPPRPPASKDARAQEMYRRALSRYAQSHHCNEPVLTGMTTSTETVIARTTVRIADAVSIREEMITELASPKLTVSSVSQAAIAPLRSEGSVPARVLGYTNGNAPARTITTARGYAGPQSLSVTPQTISTLAPQIAVSGRTDTIPNPARIKPMDGKADMIIKTKDDGEFTKKVRVRGNNKSENKIAYFIDGKRTKDGSLKKLDPDDIKEISVFKDEGKMIEMELEGYDGAILIITKKGARKMKQLKQKEN